MIDTVKIISMIDYKNYKIIENMSNIKTSYNKYTGEVHYIIINDSINGSYNSSLSVRVGNGATYNLNNYYISIERLIS